MTNQVNILPMIALRGTTVLPDMIVHFDVSREKSIRAVEAAMLHDQKIFLLTQKDPEVETPELDDLYRVGTIAYIKQENQFPTVIKADGLALGKGVLICSNLEEAKEGVRTLMLDKTLIQIILPESPVVS